MPATAPAPVPAAARPVLDGPSLVAAHLATIDRAIAVVSAQRRLRRGAAEELASDVYLGVLKHDAAILRRYRGQSSLLTYLVVVVQRVFLDACIMRDGKWRPSVRARRLGEVATVLERLIYANGLSLREAAPLVRAHTGASHTDGELEFLLALLRPRLGRRVFEAADPERLRAQAPSPEDVLIDRADAMPARVRSALEALPEADRELVRLRFERGLSLRAIAARQAIDAKAIYRRFARILVRLRATVRQPAAPPRHFAFGASRPANGPPRMTRGSGQA